MRAGKRSDNSNFVLKASGGEFVTIFSFCKKCRTISISHLLYRYQLLSRQIFIDTSISMTALITMIGIMVFSNRLIIFKVVVSVTRDDAA